MGPTLVMYELRYAYDSDTVLGQAEVRSRHAQLHDAAGAFVHCTAPFKQLLWIEHGVPDWLDEQEEAYLARVCSEHGYDVEEVGS